MDKSGANMLPMVTVPVSIGAPVPPGSKGSRATKRMPCRTLLVNY